MPVLATYEKKEHAAVDCLADDDEEAAENSFEIG
jgi:hypothetical protein